MSMAETRILKLDHNWQPQEWIDLEKAIQHEATDEVIDHLGESIFVYHGGKNRFTGEQSVVETSSIIVVTGQPNPRRYKDPALTNEHLFKRDLNLCAYCGQTYKTHELTRDHVHPQNPEDPKVARGRDVWMNVVTSCESCNSLKGNILPGQMLPKVNGHQILGPQGTGKMEPLYLPYVPCKAEHLIMKGRNIKADQMAFLLSRITNHESRMFKQH
jgi:5-methylcytosine-specific restriction endonuclease McrA